MDKAFALLEIKAVDRLQRVIEGIASTPTPDRGGDVMVPEGAEFSLPMPFLWQHNQREPIGEVFEATVRPEGIFIKARIPTIETPGKVRDRVNEAWDSISAQPPLVRGLSIGFRPLRQEPIPNTKFTRILKWMWGELSAVVLPMNSDATILAVKTAASGQHSPGVAGTPSQKIPMTIQEQISAFEAKRAASLAAAKAIQDSVSSENRSKTDEERGRYDELSLEVKACDLELKDLRDMEKMNLIQATPITNTTNAVVASDLRGGTSTTPVIHVKQNAPKGTAFTRMVMAIARGKGDSYRAIEAARSWSDMPEVEMMTKAAVAAGTTTDATWAGPLVVAQPLINEFLELLRPNTLLGRIPGLRNVPFNISIAGQTTGGTYNWVGQNKPKPVTKADFATTTLSFAKAAGIIVLTEELVKLSTPSAEALVRQEMIDGMSMFLDTQFVDPAVAAVTNVNPASVTNGAATAASGGVTGAFAKADMSARVAVFVAANIPLSGSVWLMSDSNAFGLGLSVNALGQPLFPGVSISGGSIMGIPIIVSNNVGNRVILLHAPSVLYADDGGVSIDVSREASIQMDSAPTDTVDATTVYVSLWQRNLQALKCERFITWKLARAAACTYITGVAWNGT